MMDTVKFALWKFKTIEGQCECIGFDFQCTKIQVGFNVWYVHYNLQNEIATIENATNPVFEKIDVPFDKLVDKLKNLGVWQQRDIANQHSSARVPL